MKKLFLLLLLSLSYISCTDDDTVSGDKSAYVVGFQKTTQAQSYVATGDVVPLDVPVILIGGKQGLPVDSDITISYEIDPASTAVEGTEYDKLDTTGKVLLQSGHTATTIPFAINTGNLQTGVVNSKKLIVNITTIVTQDNVVIAQNFKKMTITLTGLCFSNLAGQYQLSYSNGTTAIFTVEETSPGQYHSNSTPGYQTGVYSFDFTDVCGVLTATGWENQDGYPMSGTGVVLLPSGNLRFTLTIAGIYSNRVYTLIKL